MRFHRDRYPHDWFTVIRPGILARAGNRCEWPGCPKEDLRKAISKRGKPFKVRLTIAHLDHDTRSNDLANLRAWCEEHHLRYDARHHAKNVAETRRRRNWRAAVQLLQFPDEGEAA